MILNKNCSSNMVCQKKKKKKKKERKEKWPSRGRADFSCMSKETGKIFLVKNQLLDFQITLQEGYLCIPL